MLIKLDVKNFKRHEDLTVQLTPGLNLVTGPNWAGKSSLLQAVRYALEGAAAIPGGKAVATRWGADDHRVELTFEAEGRTYVVTRTGKKANLSRDGEVIAKSASAVTSHIAEVLGMPGQMFSKLRYGKQKETEALLTLGAGELHKIISEVSRVEVVNDVITKCTVAVSECNGGLKALPDVDVDDLSTKATDAQGKMKVLHSELGALVDSINAKTGALTTAQQVLNDSTKQAGEIDARNEERNRLSEDAVHLVKNLDSLKVKVGNLSTAEEDVAQARELKSHMESNIARLRGKVSELEEASVERDKMSQRLAGTQSEVDKYGKLLFEHPDEISTLDLEEHLRQVGEELAVKKDKQLEIRASISSGSCPTCKRPYEHGPEWLELMQQEERQLGSAITGLQQERSEAQRRLDAAKLSNDSLQKVKDLLASAQHTRDRQALDLEHLEDKAADLADQGPSAQLAAAGDEYKDHLGIAEEAEQRYRRYLVAHTELAGVEKRLLQVHAREKELGPLETPLELGVFKDEVATLTARVQELNAEYTPKAAEYTQLTGQYNSVASMLATAQEQHQKRQELESRLTTANSLASYLRKNRDRFMSTVWDGIMGKATQFTSAATGGVIEQVGRDEKGKFTYIEEGHEMPVDAASGAQRSIMGLAVQMALAGMLPSPLATIMLDEPGADMDVERALALTSLLASDAHQLLMVSHRELDGAVADNVVEL